MKHPRPIVAVLHRGPMHGKTHRVSQGQRHLQYRDSANRVHVYRVVWPADPGGDVLELRAVYQGTRRR